LPTRLAYDYATLIGPTRALLLRLQRDFLCRLGEFLSFKRTLETSIRAPGSLNGALQIFRSSPLAESLDRHGLQQFRLSRKNAYRKASNTRSGVAPVSDSVIGRMLPSRLAYNYSTLIVPTRAASAKMRSTKPHNLSPLGSSRSTLASNKASRRNCNCSAN